MPEATDQIPTGVVKAALKGSGFPFQTAVRHEIGSHKAGYRIHASEYPWLNGKNADAFLDLIAINRELVLAVECKKTKQDKYIFLLPLGTARTGDVEDFRCLRVAYFDDKRAGSAEIYCETRELLPSSPSSEFCIVSTATGTERMLERDAAILVSATDAFAQDKQEWPKMRLSSPYLIVPVLVTNAELYTARYEPSEVSLQSGEFEEVPDDLKRAPWIRFCKTFIAGRGRDLGLRSIFVVNASSLTTFLNYLEEPIGQPSNPASVKMLL